MSLKDDLNSKVVEIFRKRWTKRDGQVVPESDDIKLGLKQASFFSLQYNEIDDFAWTQLSCSSRLAG